MHSFILLDSLRHIFEVLGAFCISVNPRHRVAILLAVLTTQRRPVYMHSRQPYPHVSRHSIVETISIISNPQNTSEQPN